jgi:hypothetical protein
MAARLSALHSSRTLLPRNIIILMFLVLISVLLLTAENTGGNVGLAITQAIGLTGMLQWGMRQSAELENQMTSVERILEFTHIEQEPPLTSPQGKIKIIVLSSVCYLPLHFS